MSPLKAPSLRQFRRYAVARSLLHPRGEPRAWDAWDTRMQARAQEVLAFVRQQGSTQQMQEFLEL